MRFFADKFALLPYKISEEQSTFRNILHVLFLGAYGGFYVLCELHKNKDDQYLLEIWRLMREAQDPYANRNETNYNETFRQMRVRYMVGELTEEEWKTALQRSEKDSHFQLAKNQVKEVFINASRDLIRQVLEPGSNKASIRKQVEELVEYCNNSYKSVSSRFNRKTQLIKVTSDKAPKLVVQEQAHAQEPAQENIILQ